MTLTGKAARDLHEQLKRENQQKRTDRLARAKQEASARGKEPFDLAKLETMCATAPLGRMTRDELAAHLEEMYFVEYPKLQTLEELARKVDELGRW